MSQLGGGWFDLVEDFLVLVSDFSENLFFFVFITFIDDVLLMFELFDGVMKSEELIGSFFVEGFSFGDRAWLSFFDVCFDSINDFFGVVLVVFDFSEFFLFKVFDLVCGIFVDFFDVIFHEIEFGFFDDVVFESIMSIKTDSSISDTRTTAAHF